MFAHLTPPANAEGDWVMVILYLIIAAVFLSPQYIMQSLALYKIASRRGIRNPWLSWFPVGSDWMLGCISDQYQHRVLGKTKKRRQYLPWLRGLSVLLYIVAMVLLFTVFSQADREQLPPVLTGILALPAVALLAVTIILDVIGWMATYDLFCSCEPKNGKVYTIVSLGVSLVMPSFAIIKEILMLSVSGKDRRMIQPVLTEAPCENKEEN